MSRAVHENSVRAYRYNAMKGQIKMARKNLTAMIESDLLSPKVIDSALEALKALKLLECKILLNGVVLRGKE